MQNINLYKLMSKLYARPEVEDADIVSCMYEDDTLKTVMRNGLVVAIGVQDEYPAVALTPYTPTTRTTETMSL